MNLLKKFRIAILSGITVLGATTFAQGQQPQDPFVDDLKSSEIRPGVVEVIPMSKSQVLPDRQAAVRSRRKQQQEQGFITVTQREAQVVDALFDSPEFTNRLQDVETITNKTHLAPAPLAGTALEKATLFGAHTAGGYIDGKWTGLVRVFESDELGRVVLEEYDYVKAGSHFAIPEESVDSFYRGKPVLYSVLRSGVSDDAYTDLTWFTDRKHYRLKVGRAVNKSGKAYGQLMKIMHAFH